ncbi:MAG: hypothetical protein ACRYG6_12825 [Janthinobacterium lividum]
MSIGLVRRLPAPVRRRLVGAVDGLRLFLERRAQAARLADPGLVQQDFRLEPLRDRVRRQPGGTRVAVAGLFSSRCGLQRGAELMVLDLRARGVAVLELDLAPGLAIASDIATTAGADLSALAAWGAGEVVVHINPPDFARAMALFDPAALEDVAVVGYWAWELTVVSPEWRACAELADEIWAPSPFVAEAMVRGLPGFDGPIRVVPHAVDRAPMLGIPVAERVAARERFGLSEAAFVAGTSFSFASNYARKNPCGAIDAFRAAFRDVAGGPNAVDVRLVVRCHDVARHRRLFDHLVSYAGDDARILVWDSAVVACPIREFYGLIDVYVSLHRSEGYGLNLAEAAQAGVEVLATGWGLAPDIAARPQVSVVGSRLVVPLDTEGVYERFPGALWAEPDVADAGERLRACWTAWVRRGEGRADWEATRPL